MFAYEAEEMLFNLRRELRCLLGQARYPVDEIESETDRITKPICELVRKHAIEVFGSPTVPTDG